jgi:DNA-3-methyladenine glycosylase
LLGALLVREVDSHRVIARVVEVEAYDQDDPASHSASGPTARNASMFADAGTAYVYRSYGVHWCVNVSVGPAGTGAAVLLRAAVVVTGRALVRSRRPRVDREEALLRGPGCLAAGLDIDGPRHDGMDLLAEDGCLLLQTDDWRPPQAVVAAGPRVGVTRASDRPWRWYLDGEAAVSRYRRSPRVLGARDGP